MDAAVDAGGSCTDVVLARGRRVVAWASAGGADGPERAGELLEGLEGRFGRPRTLFLTGARAARFPRRGIRAAAVDEMTAIGRGAQRLSGLERCLAVSLGTGTALVHAEGPSYRHLGGTGVGGATLAGLGELLLGEPDPDALEALALAGDASLVDLTVGDLGYGKVGILTRDTTAANLGKIASRRPEDLAAAVHTLVGEVVGVVASQAAWRAGCPGAIVVLGRPPANRVLRAVLRRAGRLMGTRFLFPPRAALGVAIGALGTW